MKPVDPAELSGLLDGQLPPERAAEVRQALAADANLRRQYERLTRLHADLRDYAQAVAFRPEVSLAPPSRAPRVPIAPTVLAFLLVRVGLKLMPLSIGAAVGVVLLALVLAGVMRGLLAASDQEARRLSRKAAAAG